VSPEERNNLKTKILHGCPQEWPQVSKLGECLVPAPEDWQEEMGVFRDHNAKVLTTSLVTEETFPIVAGSEQELPSLPRPQAAPRNLAPRERRRIDPPAPSQLYRRAAPLRKKLSEPHGHPVGPGRA
jgi:hypothetical protein